MLIQPRPRRVTYVRHQAKPLHLAAIILVGGGVLVAQMFWVTKNQYRFAPFAIDRIKCELCGGTGLVPEGDKANAPLVLCQACFGVGVHYIRRVDENDVLCAPCEGMGRVPEGEEWRTCRRCDGRGLVRRESTEDGIRKTEDQLTEH